MCSPVVLVNSLVPGRCGCAFELIIFKRISRIDIFRICCEIAFRSMPLMMVGQHWFRYWIGAVRQQAIIWANVMPDLSRHMVSLGHNELINGLVIQSFFSPNTHKRHHHVFTVVSFNSLWPSDTIWWQRSGSILAQIMACCLMAPSHSTWTYNQNCLWHSPESFLKVLTSLILNMSSDISLLKLLHISERPMS